MARPLNRNQQLENAAFLKALRRIGNVRLAAREVGVAYGTMQHRRRQHPAFATRWNAALASAQARLNGTGARRPEARAPGAEGAHRTSGGEPVVIRLKSGKLQVRAAQPGKLTRACEQAFLSALSATCNIRLAAAAAGASEAAFARRRRRNPGFAREMRAALAEGYQRLEEALMAGFLPDSHEDDAWRHNDAPALPRMTAAEALQLMYLHQKAVTAPWSAIEKGRRGAPEGVWLARVRAEYAERVKQAAEDGLTETLARIGAGLGRSPHEVAVGLPDLSQVNASKASGKPPHHDGVALFGGWRIGDLTPEQRAAGRAKAPQGR